MSSLTDVVRNMYQANESGRKDLDDDGCKSCDVHSLGLIYTALVIRKRIEPCILGPHAKHFKMNSDGRRQKLRNLIQHTTDHGCLDEEGRYEMGREPPLPSARRLNQQQGVCRLF